MKLKVIASIFKRNKYLRIWDTPHGSQWITNGVAAYSMDGMPTLTPAILLRIFDIPEEKQSEWNCKVEPMPAELCDICTNYRASKTPLEANGITVQYIGVVNMLLSGENGEMVSIDEKYIKPLCDDRDYLRFWKCNLHNGFAVICDCGFETTALIMPIKVGESLAKELWEIGKYFTSISYIKVSNTINELIPFDIAVNPETGEILDDNSDYEQGLLEGQSAINREVYNE